MKSRILVIVVTAILMAACTPPGVIRPDDVKAQKIYAVTLEPKKNRQVWGLEIVSKAQGWRNSGKKNGYVGFDVDQAGWTFFHVKNEDLGARCTDGGDSADWVITGLRLSLSGDDSSLKGDFGGPQPAGLSRSFPGVNPLNGQLVDIPVNDAAPFLAVYNANGQKPREDGQPRLVYYEVEVSPCHDQVEQPLTTDPAWGNGGRR